MPSRTRRQPPPPVSSGLEGAAKLKVTRGHVRSFCKYVPSGMIQKEHRRFANSDFLLMVAYLFACSKESSPEQIQIPKNMKVVLFNNQKTHPELFEQRGVVYGSGHGFYDVVTLTFAGFKDGKKMFNTVIAKARADDLTWL